MIGINFSGIFDIILDNDSFSGLGSPAVSSIDESPLCGINISEFKFNSIILGSLLDSKGICEDFEFSINDFYD
jgi:hypothetical protein